MDTYPSTTYTGLLLAMCGTHKDPKPTGMEPMSLGRQGVSNPLTNSDRVKPNPNYWRPAIANP